MFLGVDYYPEYWPAELMDEDIEGILGLGANMSESVNFHGNLINKE